MVEEEEEEEETLAQSFVVAQTFDPLCLSELPLEFSHSWPVLSPLLSAATPSPLGVFVKPRLSSSPPRRLPNQSPVGVVSAGTPPTPSSARRLAPKHSR